MMTDYSFISRKLREKKENTVFYWKTETRNSPSTEISRTRRWGGICLAHTWRLNQRLRVFQIFPTSDILSLYKVGGEVFRCSAGALRDCFTGREFSPESRIRSLLNALSTKRHMWKELSVPGKLGTKLLLLELGPSSLTWKPHSSSGFRELSCILTKPSWMRSTLQGPNGDRMLWNAPTPSLSWLPHAPFSLEMLYKSWDVLRNERIKWIEKQLSVQGKRSLFFAISAERDWEPGPDRVPL